MKAIERYVDYILDMCSTNKESRELRSMLLTEIQSDFEQLIASGEDRNDAESKILDNIQEPEVFARMIPAYYSPQYYIAAILITLLFLPMIHYVDTSGFFSFFAQSNFEFVNTIKIMLQFCMVMVGAYYVTKLAIRLILPNALLKKNTLVSGLVLTIATLIATIYLAINAGFVWFNFNGFEEATMLASPQSKFMYQFYQTIILNPGLRSAYAIFAGFLFGNYRTMLHQSFEAEPFNLGDLYHKVEIEAPDEEEPKEIVPEVVETIEENIVGDVEEVEAIIEEEAETITEEENEVEVTEVTEPIEPTEPEEVKDEILTTLDALDEEEKEEVEDTLKTFFDEN